MNDPLATGSLSHSSVEAPAWFLAEAGRLDVAFDDGDVAQLGRMIRLLLEANATMNLTAITDPEEVWRKHILDALSLVPVLSSLETEGGGVCVVDVGSGGGLPALPLAILSPTSRFTLIESTGKKCRYLEATALALGLKNVTVVPARAEAVGRDPAHRARYDAATTRALGHLAIVAELTVPLLKTGGISVAIKGAKAPQEVSESRRALHALHASHINTIPTPTGQIVLLRKDRTTPALYPRAAGVPANDPIGLGREKHARKKPE